MPIKPHLVLYHDNCIDGLVAAAAASMYFSDAADYKAIQYDKDRNDIEFLRDECKIEERRSVTLLDFGFARETMLEIMRLCQTFVWLDHHKGTMDKFTQSSDKRYSEHTEINGKTHTIVLDQNKSGAMLAWEHFYTSKPPYLVDLVQDYDLWKFQYPDSKALTAALRAHSYTLRDIVALFYDRPSLDRIVAGGHSILKCLDAQIKSSLRQKTSIRIMANELGWTGLCVNTSTNPNEIGEALANESGTYGLTWYQMADGRCRCSIRSVGAFDVIQLAQVFGGGGHPNACGFITDIDTIQRCIENAENG